MKLKITAIREPGNMQKERIVMRVEAPVNVGEFVLLQTGVNESSVTNDVHNTYWFPDKEVNTGDYVVLYTKAGKPSDVIFKEVKSHFFYLAKSAPIWNERNRSAVLLYAPDWESYRPE
jgi:hypothetical protein